MVWNSEQSPLYRSVEQFNSGSAKELPPPLAEPECDSCAAPPPCQDKCMNCQHRGAQQGFLQKLTSDRDFMLIAALIILLWHEKADIKLIAALVYILLG